MPMEWYFEDRTWPERTAVYLEGAVDLFCDAAAPALDEAGADRRRRRHHRHRLLHRHRHAQPGSAGHGRAWASAQDVARVPVFGLGCAGGVSGLVVAARLARRDAGLDRAAGRVELCTLAFRLDEMTSANLVATALFGDGAAACVVSTAGRGGVPRSTAAGEHTWPDTLDIMGWDVDPQGFGVIFDRSIPTFAEANLRAAMEQIAGRLGPWPGRRRPLRLPSRRRQGHRSPGDLARSRPGRARPRARSPRRPRQHVAPPPPSSSSTASSPSANPARRLMLSALGPGFTLSALSLAA